MPSSRPSWRLRSPVRPRSCSSGTTRRIGRWPSSAATPGRAVRCSKRRASPGSPPPAPAGSPRAVAFLPADLGAALGVMLSASHNPMPDNGIKLFARGGHKLPDDLEAEIESLVHAGPPAKRPVGAAIGRVRDAVDAPARYADHLLKAVPVRLDGLHVVVDCANGSAAFVAPEV